LVRGQGFEEVDGGLEVVDYFFLGGVVGVAFWVEGADAGAVFFPFMVPEGFIVSCRVYEHCLLLWGSLWGLWESVWICSTLIVFPVGVHVVEEVGFAGGGDNGRDVGVGARGIAVGVVGAVAVVGPWGCYY